MEEKGEMTELERKTVSGIVLTMLLGSMVFPAIILVKGDTETHDLYVLLKDTLKAPNHLPSGNSTSITYIVVNNGTVTEDNVTVLLLIKDTYETSQSTTGLRLSPNQNYTTSFMWAPDNGVWNVTVYAPPVSEESITTNNVASKLVNVCLDEPPIVSFDYWPRLPIMNDNVIFDALNSTDPDWGNITTYSWSLNGTIENTSASICQYPFPTWGDVTVTLTLYDTEGEKSSSTVNMTVCARPVPKFSVDGQGPYFVQRILTFNGSASYDPDNINGPNRGIANYAWDFDDGNTSAIAYPTINHTYQANGTYNVRLNVTDLDDGLTDSVNETVTVFLEVFVEVVDNATGNTTILYDPGETFIVNVTVNNVENLSSFYFKLSWPVSWLPPAWPDLFDPESVYVQYGGFLGLLNYADGRTRVIWTWTPHVDEGYITANATLIVPEPCSGNGTLALVTFKVATSGECTLQLSQTVLTNQSMSAINHTAVSGTFYTRNPVGNFTHSPLYPSVNRPTSFNATVSYDPDNDTGSTRGIADYAWDFNDGTPTVLGNDPITYHNYTNEGSYNVTLTLTDYDEDLTWNFTQTINVSIHDAAITDVEPPLFQFNETIGEYETRGMLPINVTVINNGTFPGETFNVTAYATSATLTVEIGTETISSLQPEVSQNLTFHLYAFEWNTYGLPKDSYTIIANITWMESGVESDINPSNNNCTCKYPVQVHLAGDANGDSMVSMDDIMLELDAFGSKIEGSRYGANLDLNGDGRISMDDIMICLSDFGQHYP
jgi:hypothetical protein